MRPSMKAIFAMVVLALFSLFANAQDRNEGNVLFEDENVVVSFTIESCNVVNSDLVFEYYLITVINKTDKKINLQYWSKPKREDTSQENFHSIILQPNQKLTPQCDENNPDLRFYRSRPVNGESIETMELQLNAFEIFQL